MRAVVLMIVLCFTVWAEEPGNDTLAGGDSTMVESPVLYDSMAVVQDSVSIDTAFLHAPEIKTTEVAPLERKIKLIKRNYNYRQQVVLAVAMMTFIALVMSSSQSWNPK